MGTLTRSVVQPTQFSTPINFVELIGRSNFSFLQGASHPNEMVLQAKSLGYRGLAICDLNGLYGVVKGYEAAERPSSFTMNDAFALASQNDDFKYHIGTELTFSDFNFGSLVLLPMNKEGYSHLCQILTLALRKSPKGFSSLSLKQIQPLSDELIACPLPPWHPNTINQLREIFPRRLYLPVWKDFSWSSVQIYQQALQLEEKFDLPLFATQRPFMHHPDRKPLHDVLTCILHQTTLNKANTLLLANSERHLKPLHELTYLWRERPDLLSRTLEISNRLEFSLTELRYQYPRSQLPPKRTAAQHLSHQVEKGLAWRFPQGQPPHIRQLVEHEISIITEMGYEDYFLTIWDICEFARRKDILFQGRGSAANSVVCFALGLTAVDPTQIQFLFERFISKERGEPPDIDIDFESDRREEVLQYVYQKYGELHAAMVSTVICYRTRMALRETAKVLEIPQTRVDHLVKLAGREGLREIMACPKKVEKFEIDSDKFQLLMKISYSLQGFPRHLGIHTGGFLISERPVTECVPIEKASMDRRFVIQWNKDDLTTLKMMKVDILGLGMLTALRKCFALLRIHKKIDLSLSTIPAYDKPTYKMIQEAKTVGTFQIESRAQMSLLPRLKPSHFYDLVIQVAIVRPGPIQGGMIHPFIRRRHGRERVHYPHPKLEAILGKTLGVPIFQEQIMQIASTVGDFTPGEADELRRLMSSSWKNPDVMSGLRQRLLNGMLNHGISLSDGEKLYQTIEGFASYGFPESHAASFALLTYASCYLKCHHPELFVCSLLNSQPMGFYSSRTLIGEAQRSGVKFLPLSIHKSEYDYTVENTSVTSERPDSPRIRMGFRAVYGLKRKHIESLIENRSLIGSFDDLEKMIRRTQLPRHILIRLASAGAFDDWRISPRAAIWTIQSLSLDPQSLLFGRPKENFNLTSDICSLPGIEIIPSESLWEQLMREYKFTGLSLNYHPLSLLRSHLTQANHSFRQKNLIPYVCSEQLSTLNNGTPVRVAGLLSIQQRPPTAKGFSFLTLEDETGFFNIVLTPQVYQAYRLTLLKSPLLEVQGVLEKCEGVINIKALKLFPLNWRP